MKTATKIKDLNGFQGHAILYKITPAVEYDKPWDDDDPPAKHTEYVVVSAANVMFSGPETYIYIPANEDGEIVDWGELDGSFRGGLNHEAALEGAGYLIK
jgi:ethanolamine utilization protein EutP (predicted NTPase)